MNVGWKMENNPVISNTSASVFRLPTSVSPKTKQDS